MSCDWINCLFLILEISCPNVWNCFMFCVIHILCRWRSCLLRLVQKLWHQQRAAACLLTWRLTQLWSTISDSRLRRYVRSIQIMCLLFIGGDVIINTLSQDSESHVCMYVCLYVCTVFCCWFFVVVFFFSFSFSLLCFSLFCLLFHFLFLFLFLCVWLLITGKVQCVLMYSNPLVPPHF